MPALPSVRYTGQKLDPYRDPQIALKSCIAIQLAPGNPTTYLHGTIMGQVDATGLFAAYNAGHTDGTQTPRCILMYDCTVDTEGKIALTGQSNQLSDEFSFTYKYVTAYFRGTFRCEDLIGLDANAVALFGRIAWGDFFKGEFIVNVNSGVGIITPGDILNPLVPYNITSNGTFVAPDNSPVFPMGWWGFDSVGPVSWDTTTDDS